MALQAFSVDRVTDQRSAQVMNPENKWPLQRTHAREKLFAPGRNWTRIAQLRVRCSTSRPRVAPFWRFEFFLYRKYLISNKSWSQFPMVSTGDTSMPSKKSSYWIFNHESMQRYLRFFFWQKCWNRFLTNKCKHTHNTIKHESEYKLIFFLIF